MAAIAMKNADWARELRVVIVGAVAGTVCAKGVTTPRPPCRHGDCTKVEILGDDGKHHQVAISRVRINGN